MKLWACGPRDTSERSQQRPLVPPPYLSAPGLQEVPLSCTSCWLWMCPATPAKNNTAHLEGRHLWGAQTLLLNIPLFQWPGLGGRSMPWGSPAVGGTAAYATRCPVLDSVPRLPPPNHTQQSIETHFHGKIRSMFGFLVTDCTTSNSDTAAGTWQKAALCCRHPHLEVGLETPQHWGKVGGRAGRSGMKAHTPGELRKPNRRQQWKTGQQLNQAVLTEQPLGGVREPGPPRGLCCMQMQWVGRLSSRSTARHNMGLQPHKEAGDPALTLPSSAAHRQTAVAQRVSVTLSAFCLCHQLPRDC